MEEEEMRRFLVLLLLFCASGARADSSPDSGQVAIRGVVYPAHDVTFRIVDDVGVVIDTPSSRYMLWEVPDPEAPAPPADPTYTVRHVIYDELGAAVRNSSNWEAEKAAVQAVVDAHPSELRAIVPNDGAHGYEIFFTADSLDGDIWMPVRTTTPDSTMGTATRASTRRGLAVYVDRWLNALNEGALLVVWSRGLRPPGVQIFRGPEIRKVLREIELIKAVQDSVRLLSPKAVEAMTPRHAGGD
jgi:hypothetical protein